jgi:hypothetical protein
VKICVDGCVAGHAGNCDVEDSCVETHIRTERLDIDELQCTERRIRYTSSTEAAMRSSRVNGYTAGQTGNCDAEEKLFVFDLGM